MDDRTFDGLTRTIAANSSRRQAARLLAGGVAGGLLALMGAGRAQADYSRDCRRFALSGGSSPSKNIHVDDLLKVFLNGNRLEVKKAVPNTPDNEAGERLPVKFYARRGDTLEVIAKDVYECCWALDPLYLHCIENGTGSRRLWATKLPINVRCDCSRSPRGVFFREKMTI